MEPHRMQDVMSPKVVVSEFPEMGGRGLFAQEPIEVGEVVWGGWITETPNALQGVFRWREIEADPIKVRYAYQFAPDSFTLAHDVEQDPSSFYNHSCDPNTWYDHSYETLQQYFNDYVWPTVEGRRSREATFADFVSMSDLLEITVARRPIRPGEHVTMDYGSFWTVCDQDFECGCGAPGCRQWIRKDDFLLVDPGHTSRFVAELLARG